MTTPAPVPDAHGSCLCGAVAFSAPLPARWVAHCHCTRCQRAHGAAFVTWAGFAADLVALTDPQQQLRWHAHGEARRGFCGRCGSPMFFQSSHYPGELHIARALIQSPMDQAPQCHAFFSTHVHWATLAEPLPIEPRAALERAGARAAALSAATKKRGLRGAPLGSCRRPSSAVAHRERGTH